MSKVERTKEILGLIVVGAEAIVGLSKLWEQIEPEVKRIVKNFVNACKKLTDENYDNKMLKTIEAK